MCGIAGKLGFHPAAFPTHALLADMCNTIAHRGPDDAGYFIQGPIALGHRRLSVIDVMSGHQPLGNEDDTIWVVLNGEIYNFVELREQLEQKGHRLRTRSDTEVIVHLYEEYGETFVEHLRGMFAIALWDTRCRRLVLVRDRLGKKPLYYAVVPNHGIVFASEIKAILEDSSVPRTLNYEAFDAYMSLLYVPSPMSIFQGIQKLPAGHLLTWCDDKIEITQYWDLVFQARAELSERAALEELEATIREAVRIRLRSDVPLGAFLSGGIDSSLVVRHMADQVSRPVLTCSVGFDEHDENELEYAKEIAQFLQCTHHEHTIVPRVEDIVRKLTRLFDEPFADSSAVPTYYVSEMARRHVTVALSGDGGDEVFAGYARHYLHRIDGVLRKYLGPVGCHAVSRVAHLLPPFKGQKILARLGMSPGIACAKPHTDILFGAELKRRVYSTDCAEYCRRFEIDTIFTRLYDQCTASDPLDKALYVDMKTYLVDDILVKVDRMSMAHALEVRAPLLDHKLVELSATLPSAMKLNGHTTKYLLRQSLRGHVPDSVLNRKKQGFTMPLAGWLRGPLRPMVEDTVLSQRAFQRGLFHRQALRDLWSAHLDHRADYSHQLWQLFMLELWHQEYLDPVTS
ncbi:MAG: asparagine synthase (glutamine-hydrolyzing) [Nitrospira sp.]|nr:asparagine synthase (glutamine-hydrolyzing) [Nitrospira sp.]